MDTNTMNGSNNENLAGPNPEIISPDQTTMSFAEKTPGSEDVVKIDIPHNEPAIFNLGSPAVEESPTPEQNVPLETTVHDEVVASSTKIKVLAALAIVGVAGYIAYWVQEPVQLKADVLNETSTATDVYPASTSDVAATDSSATTSDSTTATTGPVKNVDVSLFGFEPAVVKIDAGTTVIWTNTSSEDQTLIGSSEDGESFTSPVMTSGATFNYIFDKDATFTYYSTYNPALKATLTVGEGGTTTASVPDDSTTPTPTLFGSADVSPTTTSTPATTAADTSLTPPVTDTALAAQTAATSTTSTVEDLKAAAPDKLTKTGPAENLYVVVLLGIAWFNRKKLVKIFR